MPASLGLSHSAPEASHGEQDLLREILQLVEELKSDMAGLRTDVKTLRRSVAGSDRKPGGTR